MTRLKGSIGCAMNVGEIHGNFLILETNGEEKTRDIMYRCECQNCGEERIMSYRHLRERVQKNKIYCMACQPRGKVTRKPEPSVWDKAVYAWNHKWPWLGVIE